MSVFLPSTVPAREPSGAVAPSATWEFMRRNSSVPQNTLSNSSVVVSDSQGQFGMIELNNALNYRAVLKNSEGKVLLDLSDYIDALFAAGTKVALDAQDEIIVGATWNFFDSSNPTTPATVYADSSLEKPLGVSITSKSDGTFPETFLDTTVTYRAVLKNAEGVELSVIDPVNESNMGTFLDPDFMAPLEPSDDWDGTAGSGFSSTPSDPTRTTAKPAMHLLVPPNQYFTDDLAVGVIAYANNNGTLIGGIEKVRFHFEGTTQDVTNPTLRTFTRYDGTTYNCLGYWVTLSKPSGTAGHANLYVEAFPADATMQNRVIGPYQFSPQDSLYDEELTVTPSQAEAGTNYQTVAAAIERHRSNSNDSTLITITEALTEDLTTMSGTPYEGNGYCVIEATAPVTFARATYTTDGEADFRPRVGRLWFKGDITWDLKEISALRNEDPATHDGSWVCEGIKFTNSGGRGDLWRAGRRPFSHIIRQGGWMLECDFENLGFPLANCNLGRGCTGSTLFQDVCSDTNCAIYTRVDGLDSTQEWLLDVSALDVTYTGSESTATFALAGGSDANTRTFTATWGSNSDTFVVGATEARYTTANDGAYDPTTAGEGYYFQDVADWLNSLTGWTATVVDNTRRASSASLADLKGIGFAAQNVKDTTLNIVSCFDLHGDFLQLVNLGENMICAHNHVVNARGQNLFLGSNTTAPKDMILVNNAFANVLATTGYALPDENACQWSRQLFSHVIHAHNSMANQQFNFRFDNSLTTDAYCLVANNAHPQIVILGTSDGNVVIADNVIDAGETAPSGATGTVIAGDYLSKFADSVNADFTPAGELAAAANLKTPIVNRNLDNTVRSDPDSVGAI